MFFDSGRPGSALQKSDKPVTRRSARLRAGTCATCAASVRDLMARGVVFERYEGMQQDDLNIWSPVPGEGVAWFKDPDANLLSLNGPI